MNSVSNAYEQLLAEGYIYSMERKGYYVENINQFMIKDDLMINKLPNDLKENLINKKGLVLLSHMTSDISLFPFKEWMKCQGESYKKL